MIKATALAALVALAVLSPASAAEPFRFEREASLQDMQALVTRDVAVGMPRDQVRAIFVDQGGATLKAHPSKAGVEKYIYDIDLCSYYVWRWNISADYDGHGRLKQLYVNALPALANAPEPPMPGKGPFMMLSRPRPQAFKGERSLKAIVSKDQTILTGVGPTRVDPLNMGHAYPYTGEVWRSIFDSDDAGRIVPYTGDCAAADAAYARARNGAPGSTATATPPTDHP